MIRSRSWLVALAAACCASATLSAQAVDLLKRFQGSCLGVTENLELCHGSCLGEKENLELCHGSCLGEREMRTRNCSRDHV